MKCETVIVTYADGNVQLNEAEGARTRSNCRGFHQTDSAKLKSQTPATHCTRKSPLPLLPSGPGGVGGNASRGTDA
jgi:hypothetical protein